MIILDAINKSLEIRLLSSVTTNELQFTCSFVDITTASFLAIEYDGVTDGTSAVAIIPSPSVDKQRQWKFSSIYNDDTVSQTAIIQLNNNGIIRIIGQWVLNPGYSLIYNLDSGFEIFDNSGIPVGQSSYSGYSGYSGNSTSGYSGVSGDSTSGYSGVSGVSGESGISGYSGVFVNKTTQSPAGNYQVLSTDFIVSKIGISISGDSVTLPLLSDCDIGQPFVVSDESGTASDSDPISVYGYGSEMIDGVNFINITVPYGFLKVYKNSSGTQWKTF